MNDSISYKKAGVDITISDQTKKKEIAKSLETDDNRVLNRIGSFATLFSGSFDGYKEPFLVLKTEEPGSKQKLAFQYNKVAGICYDLVNHLVNDIAVMGAQPLSIQDAIICGKFDRKVVADIVDNLAKACKEQECLLTGGETSEQPGVIEPGLYILTASVVGLVERSKVIDGSMIKKGDIVLGVASNGLHTNGYSLVRTLIDRNPGILDNRSPPE
jgi:phosphoribosylformylglycinamidine cyclo-ligase